MPGSTISPSVTRNIFPTPCNDEFQDRRIYETLDPSRQEIRRIRLHLNDDDGLVRCDLLPAVSLSLVKNQYTAISYCAGDPTDTKPILVNGVRFNVFANLAHALDITRDFWTKTFPSTECLLWADQICINQSNLTERSHQVGFMRRIYSSAAQTLICLSTSHPHQEDETNTLGIEWLTELHQSVHPGDDYYKYYFQLEHHLRTQLFSSSPPSSSSSFSSSTSHTGSAPDSSTAITTTTNNNSGDSGSQEPKRRRASFTDGWRAFYATIFASPWWLRAWVYQEFVSSASLYFLYGRASVPWSRVSEVLPTLRKYHGNFGYDFFNSTSNAVGERGGVAVEGEVRHPGAVLSMEDAVNFFVVSKMRFDRAGPYELMDLLAQSRHLRSADRRDGVYAFLGLVREDYGIVPDYSEGNTIERLLLDVAGRVVAKDKRLDILSYACKARGGLSGRLPSWVPDWTCGSCGRVCETNLKQKQEKLPPALEPRVHDGTRLEVHGYKIGTFEYSRRLVLHLEGVGVSAGLLGLKEDEIWALIGARDPFVLRPVDGGYLVIKGAMFNRQTDLSRIAHKCGFQSQKLFLV